MTARPQVTTRPATKAARHARILELLERIPVRSQPELAALLAEDGLVVAQATLSRDLVELGAVKVRDPGGGLVYAAPGEGGDRSPRAALAQEVLDARLARLCEELVVTAEHSANLVVLRTPPGAAQFLASSVDHSVLPEALGCVAGDDTVIVVARRPDGGEALARRFLELAGRGDTPTAAPPTTARSTS